MHYFSSHSNGFAGPSICIADGIVERYDHIRSHYASWGLSPCVPYVIVDLVCSLSSMPGMVLFFGMFSGLEGRQFLVRKHHLLTPNITLGNHWLSIKSRLPGLLDNHYGPAQWDSRHVISVTKLIHVSGVIMRIQSLQLHVMWYSCLFLNIILLEGVSPNIDYSH